MEYIILLFGFFIFQNEKRREEENINGNPAVIAAAYMISLCKINDNSANTSSEIQK